MQPRAQKHYAQEYFLEKQLRFFKSMRLGLEEKDTQSFKQVLNTLKMLSEQF